MPAHGVWAWSSFGALAALVLALALADARRPFLAGVAAGVAVLMRFDWVLVVAPACVPYLWAASRRDRLRGLLGFACAAGVYVPYLAVVGPAHVRLMLVQLHATEPGRHLPLPQWQFYPGYLLALMLVSVALLIVLGVRRRRTSEGLTFLAGGLAGAALLPSVLARPDAAHIGLAAVMPVTLLAAAVPAAAADVRTVLARVRPLVRVGAMAAALALVLWMAVPFLVGRRYEPLLGLDDLRSALVTHDGRSFRLVDGMSSGEVAAALGRVDALTRSGDRVFVGPVDLRRTNYAESYLYYLLPRLRPATFYLELNPNTANRRGSGLAGDVRNADVLLLTSRYDAWSEPNNSVAYGSSLPNRIVRRDFCARGTFGSYRVLKRCSEA
jgi:hypothetical protein